MNVRGEDVRRRTAAGSGSARARGQNAGGGPLGGRRDHDEDGPAAAPVTSWRRAYVSLGSNQGDREGYLEAGRKALAEHDRVRVVRQSAVYETAPWGLLDQPDFLNQVILVETTLEPEQLLALAHEIEQEAERVREVRWGPRTLDVDILWYDGIVAQGEDLELPHPRLEGRRFVLEPLAELEPDLRLASGRTAREALKETLDQDVRRYERGKGDDVLRNAGGDTGTGGGEERRHPGA